MRVLLLDIDSLSPAHMGCYGYHRNTTPNIDRLAAQGVRFDNYYTSDAPCAPSRAALMSGRFGIHSGIVGHGGTAADFRREGQFREFDDTLSHESLPAFLSSAGLKTVLFSPFAVHHAQWTFYAGFSEIHTIPSPSLESAEDVTPHVLEWVERNADQDDWFMYVNYWDPHTPYRAPLSFGHPFDQEPLPEWITDDVLEAHKRKVGPHSAREINMYDNETDPAYPRHIGEIQDRNDLRKMIDGYDTAIRYTDEHIGQLFEALARKGILDDLIVFITADHGENMGQLGIYGEHGTANHGTCHIPMIVRWPGVTSPRVDTGLHYHLDLAPTFAELLDKPKCGSWDGQSFAPALKAGEDCGRDYLVVSQCAHVCQRSVRFGDWMYTRTYHDGYHLFPNDMLFHLKEDPFEQHDVAADHGAVVKDAVYYLNQWHDEMMQSMPYDVDPLWTVMKEGGPYHARGYLQSYIEHLERTDRAHAIPELKRRHPSEFTDPRGKGVAGRV